MSFSSLKKQSLIESKFVTKAVLDENLEEIQIKSKEDDSNISLADRLVDPRSLYDQLQANKNKAEEEFQEKLRLSKTMKRLDAEELAFLEATRKAELEKKMKIKEEENKELTMFQEAQLKALKGNQDQASEEDVIEIDPTEFIKSKQKTSNRSASTKPIVEKKDFQKQLFSSIVVKRKEQNQPHLSSASLNEPSKLFVSTDSKQLTTKEVTNTNQAAEKKNENSHPSKKQKLSTGLVAYDSDSD